MPEADRSDKPAYVRNTNFTPAKAQVMCQSQLRAIMTADDQFGATMQLLSDRGVLANTLVIFSSDNGYMWGEHGRTEKFVPYEPSIRVPLLVRWPGHIARGHRHRPASPRTWTCCRRCWRRPAFTLPADAPRWTASRCSQPADANHDRTPSTTRTRANGNVPTWRMVRTATVEVHPDLRGTGAVSFREYYDLVADPAENTNLLGDASTANDPPAAELSALVSRLGALSTCRGSACVV